MTLFGMLRQTKSDGSSRLSSKMIKSLLLALVLSLASMAFSGPGPVICIDPGHPSENGVGTRGKKITEVQAAWKVALILKGLLEQAGFKVVMTKSSENQHVTNKARAETANRAHAALMVRLHCDAAADSGIASYYPATKGTVKGVSGPSDEVIASSRKAGKAFHAALIQALAGALKDRGLKTDRQTAIGGKQGALTGSIYSKVPVILVEMCVLQSNHDEAFISTATGQRKLAQAILEGVRAAVASDH